MNTMSRPGMTADQMLAALAGVEVGATVFFDYSAGKKATAQAIAEAAPAIAAGENPTHLVGTLDKIAQNAKGEWYVTIRASNRQGAYRAINPALGTLHAVQVIAAAIAA